MRLWKSLLNLIGEKDPRTLIVCGGRRTGTTLLASILCSNPGANPLGQEAQILTRIVESYRWSINNYHDFGKSFFKDRSSLKALFRIYVRNFIRQASDYASPENILVLKNPELSKVLDYIYELLPEATYFITIRDPRDQISAELEVVARRRLQQNIAGPTSDRNIESLIALYKSYLDGILRFQSKTGKKAVIIRYEDLVQDWENTLSKLELASGLKLPFDPRQNWPRVSEHAGLQSSSPSSSVLYGKPISNNSIGRYKNDLLAEEIYLIDKAFHEFKQEYGY